MKRIKENKQRPNKPVEHNQRVTTYVHNGSSIRKFQLTALQQEKQQRNQDKLMFITYRTHHRIDTEGEQLGPQISDVCRRRLNLMPQVMPLVTSSNGKR